MTQAGKPRIIVVVGGIPHPSVGASLVIYYCYLQGLREAGYEVLNLLLLQPDNSTEASLAAYRQAMEGPDFRILVAQSPRFVRTNRFGHRYDHAALRQVRAQVEAFDADVTLCLDLPAAWAVHGWHIGRRVAWLGDLFFQNYLLHALYGRAEGQTSTYQLLITRWHTFLWERIYHRVLKRFDAVVASAKSSEEALASVGVTATYLPYPWPGEDPLPLDSPKASLPTFFFFGQLQGLGSRSAFHIMTGGIYPALVRALGRGGFEILVGGRGGLPAWVETAIADKPEVRYLGFVEDLDPVLTACHAVLAPIDAPVGNRSRILTALSKRALVVAHRNTALGNPDLVDQASCYLAENAEEFVDRLLRPVSRPQEANAVAEQGYQVYKTRFSPEAAVPLMLAVLRDAAGRSKR